MKRLLPFLLLTLFAHPASATITTSQHRSNLSCGGVTSCAVTGFTAIPAGSLIIGIGINAGTTLVASAGTSGAGTWVVPSGCGGTNADCHIALSGAGAIAFQYVLSSTGTPTTINVTGTTSSVDQAEVMVFTFTAGPMAFDVGSDTTRTTCTTCAAVTLSPTGSSEVMIQGAAGGQALASSASAGFVGASPYSAAAGGVADFPASDGTAAAITTSGTAPNWSQSPTGVIAVTAMAFKETGAVGATCNNRIALMGAGCK